MVEITVNIQNNADADTTPAITVPTAAPAITGPSRFLNIHLQGCSAEARVINVEVPLSATFALVRELAKVDPKFTFKIPNLAVTRELEGMLPLAMVPTPDITMEVPFVGHVVSKTAVRLPAYDEEGGQIKNYHYQYTFSKAEENEARVLVVIGESGTGKTTLLDTIVNYCLGIQEDDTVRYRLINESGIKNNEGCSKTDSCTEYHIERTPRNPPLLVIDTPGFGDTRGLKQDQIIAGQIREVFKKRTVIHSVCFVVKSSTTRLQNSQEYVLAKMSEMFGSDITPAISILATFCDGGKILATEALNKSKAFAPVKTYFDSLGQGNKPIFTFNNSATFTDKSLLENTTTTSQFWKMGMDNIRKFFDVRVTNIQPVHLHDTQENIRKREKIEFDILDMNAKFKAALDQKTTLENTMNAVQQLKITEGQNQNFQVTVPQPVTVTKQKPKGTYNTVCISCSHTCHFSCAWADNQEKANCCAMDGNGYCTSCPNKCHWSSHKNLDHYYASEMTTKTVPNEEMKKRYGDAKDNKVKQARILASYQKDLMRTELGIQQCNLNINKSIQELSKIALYVNSYSSTSEYIKMQIEVEKQAMESGWQDRVKNLNSSLQQSEYLSRMVSSGKLSDVQAQVQTLQQQLNQFNVNKFADDYNKNVTEKTSIKAAQSYISKAVGAALNNASSLVDFIYSR